VNDLDAGHLAVANGESEDRKRCTARRPRRPGTTIDECWLGPTPAADEDLGDRGGAPHFRCELRRGRHLSGGFYRSGVGVVRQEYDGRPAPNVTGERGACG
jgi:hypothetical protein